MDIFYIHNYTQLTYKCAGKVIERNRLEDEARQHHFFYNYKWHENPKPYSQKNKSQQYQYACKFSNFRK